MSQLWLDLLRTLLALAAVCALSVVTLRFLARRGLGGLGAAPNAALQIVARVALEPRKTLYLVRAGKRVLLVGVGDGAAPQLVAELDESALSVEAERVGGPPST